MTPVSSRRRAVIWTAVSSEAQARDDKVSLKEQERLAREWCEANDYDVIAVLSVPGFSRREADLIDALAAFEQAGVTAFRELRSLWKTHAFDVLVAYHHNRIGRSTTLHSYIVENVILSGASIYLHHGGLIDSSNFRFHTAMGGAAAAMEIDTLTEKRAAGILANAARGFLPSSTTPFSHRTVRDAATGKRLRVEVRDDLRPLFDCWGRLLLARLAYPDIPREAYFRYGFAHPRGGPYPPIAAHKFFTNPLTYGHVVINTVSDLRPTGPWLLDASEPAPEGMVIFRDVAPPVFVGQLAEDIKSEVLRRMTFAGKMSPYGSQRFAGLCVCGECGRTMMTFTKAGGTYRALRCGTHKNPERVGRSCSQNRFLSERYLIAWLNRWLEAWMAAGAFVGLDALEADDHALQHQQLETEMARLEKRRGNLVLELADCDDDDLRLSYRDLLRATQDDLRRLSASLEQARSSTARQLHAVGQQQNALSLIRERGLSAFWAADKAEINQVLRKLLGKNRIVILDRKIRGFTRL